MCRAGSFVHPTVVPASSSSLSTTPVHANIQVWGAADRVVQNITLFQPSDGRPTSLVLDSGDAAAGGGIIAIRNLGPLEYPLVATVAPLWEEQVDDGNHHNFNADSSVPRWEEQAAAFPYEDMDVAPPVRDRDMWWDDTVPFMVDWDDPFLEVDPFGFSPLFPAEMKQIYTEEW